MGRAATVSQILENVESEPLMMDGQRLTVKLAVQKDEAKVLKTRFGKRNLHLAKEGLVLDPHAMSTMEEKELSFRLMSWREKQEKLKDRNMQISTTRLAVRNIPSFVTVKMLRAVFHKTAVNNRKQHGVKSIFEKQSPKIMQSKKVNS